GRPRRARLLRGPCAGMSTFVLLHGAFRGAWSWSRVVPLLVAAGHEVHAPTLSGTATGLDGWVDEVTDLIVDADLTEVVLVGHNAPLTRPEVVAELLLTAADNTRRETA